MTPAQKFAAWLGPAMRRAGLDIDRQQGGGRAKLADACGVSRSTVGRWLDGQTTPGPEHFEAIARTLDTPVTDLLVGTGIISAESLAPLGSPPPDQPPSIEEVAAKWQIRPEDREFFFSVAEQFRKRATPTE